MTSNIIIYYFCSAHQLLIFDLLLCLPTGPEDGGSTSIWNVGKILQTIWRQIPEYTTSTLLAMCYFLITRSSYPMVLKMDAIRPSETSVNISDYMASHPKWHYSFFARCLVLPRFFLGLLIDPEGRGSTFLRNVGRFISNYTTLQSREQNCTEPPLWVQWAQFIQWDVLQIHDVSEVQSTLRTSNTLQTIYSITLWTFLHKQYTQYLLTYIRISCLMQTASRPPYSFGLGSI
jgi:hypothetical protein